MGNLRTPAKRRLTFEERLAEEAERLKKATAREPPGSMARALLLRRSRQAETASRINDWLRSPGLQQPKSGAKLSTIALDLADADQALAVARQMAEHTGRTVTVRDADGEILDRIKPAAKN